MSTIDQQFVEYIVKSLVGNPDDVIVERIIDEKGVLLSLTVNPDDLGRVIGKRGATAQSLRTLLRALGTKNDARYNLKIVDNGEPRPQRSYDDRPRDDYQPQQSNDDQQGDDQSSQNDDVQDEVASEDVVEETPVEEVSEEDHDSVLSKTRRELEE